jgi:broad specificity phosphatase PhoE
MLPQNRINAQGFRRWIKDYNASTLRAKSLPPDRLSTYARQSEMLVCSKQARSLDSARALDAARPLIFDAAFNEAGIPSANWTTLKLSPSWWAVVFRVLWLFGYHQNCESFTEAKQRAVLAAQRLEALAREHGRVLLLGHGVFNRMIARQLKNSGWSGPASPSNRHWGMAIYHKTATGC